MFLPHFGPKEFQFISNGFPSYTCVQANDRIEFSFWLVRPNFIDQILLNWGQLDIWKDTNSSLNNFFAHLRLEQNTVWM